MFNYDELFTLYNAIHAKIRANENRYTELELIECEKMEAKGEDDWKLKETFEMSSISGALEFDRKLRSKINELMQNA